MNTEHGAPSARPELWNPDVAAALSVVLSPIFGATIQALNWHRLGQRRRARIAWLWVAFNTIVPLAIGGYAMTSTDNEHAVARIINLALFAELVLWYFASARSQSRYLTHEIQGAYTRASWLAPLCAVVVIVGSVYGLAASAQGRDRTPLTTTSAVRAASTPGTVSLTALTTRPVKSSTFLRRTQRLSGDWSHRAFSPAPMVYDSSAFCSRSTALVFKSIRLTLT